MRDVVWSSSRTRVYKANHCGALEWGPLELICRTADPDSTNSTPMQHEQGEPPADICCASFAESKGGSSPLGRSISHQLDSPYIVSLSHRV